MVFQNPKDETTLQYLITKATKEKKLRSESVPTTTTRGNQEENNQKPQFRFEFAKLHDRSSFCFGAKPY